MSASNGEPDLDCRDPFESVFLAEERCNERGYADGFSDGTAEGNTEGYHLGYHRGAELGAELGYYYSFVNVHRSQLPQSERLAKAIETLKAAIDAFPQINDENYDILANADTIRALFRKTCALLKVSGKYPEADELNF